MFNDTNERRSMAQLTGSDGTNVPRILRSSTMWQRRALTGHALAHQELAARQATSRCSFLSILFSCFLFLSLTSVRHVYAQEIDLLLKGGHVIDPRGEIDSQMDVAIADGKIFRIAENIPASDARGVVDVSGLYVTPGLIDLHVHAFYQEVARAIHPDAYAPRSGVTTVVDAGTSGWRNFPRFKAQTIDNSRTRVLAFLSIVGLGSSYMERLGRTSIITQNTADMDPVLTAERIREYSEIIVGVKAQHYRGADYTPELRAVEAGELAGVPVMVDFGGHDPPRSLERLLLEVLRPGDMLTHTYADVGGREAVVDDEGQVKSFVVRARERGVLFAVGHGGGSFRWHQVIPSMEQGFYPDIIDTDTHITSINEGMKDMTNLMSKFLNIDMSLQDVILRTTWNPARYINREDLGHLTEGSEADVAVFSLLEGDFGFIDSGGRVLRGTRKLQAELTIRAGEVVWDLNGIAAPEWDEEPIP